jgi:hypothetical protein
LLSCPPQSPDDKPQEKDFCAEHNRVVTMRAEMNAINEHRDHWESWLCVDLDDFD